MTFITTLRFVVCAAISIKGIVGISATAETHLETSKPIQAGPYCGVDCVYAVAQHYRKHVSYSELLAPEFVGSFQGSNLAELVAAVESIGLSATPQAGTTLEGLRSTQHPTILLLSKHRDSIAFHHWVLVLNANTDHIVVMEAPGNIESLSSAQLLAQWDGLALIVYPDTTSKSYAEARSSLGKWGMALFSVGGLLVMFASRKLLPKSLTAPDFRPLRALLSGAVLLSVGSTSALIWHGLSTEGFFHNSEALAIVKARFFSHLQPHITLDEMKAVIESNRALVIDARDEASYMAGHIPTAINIPVYVSPTALQAFARELPTDQKIVVYCQSDGCDYDDQIASQLHLLGVKDITIYHGGWRDWKQQVQHVRETRDKHAR